MGAGRKLRNHRRTQLWADKDYKKSHLGNEWKKPFAGASHAKGIVLEKMYAIAAFLLDHMMAVAFDMVVLACDLRMVPGCTWKQFPALVLA